MLHLRRTLPLTLIAFAGATSLASAGTSTAPPGYRRVQSPLITAPAGSAFDTGGQVSCPAGTVVWGGDVSYVGGSPVDGDSINTAAPTANGWKGRYNNTSANDLTFRIQAFCARAPRRYAQVFQVQANPNGGSVSATATCPRRTVLLGGGASSTGDSVSAFQISAWPSSSKTYSAWMFNGGDRDEQLVVYALCGARPPGYAIVSNTSTSSSGSALGNTVGCPAGTTLTGGGVKVAIPRPQTPLGSSGQNSGEQWYADVLNTSGLPITTTVYAICAA
jgi:hypothetical protein